MAVTFPGRAFILCLERVAAGDIHRLFSGCRAANGSTVPSHVATMTTLDAFRILPAGNQPGTEAGLHGQCSVRCTGDFQEVKRCRWLTGVS